jgi:hypothetical protein
LNTLAPNANCSVSINFMPPSVGTFSATLQVMDNAPGSPQTLALSGTGIAPAPAVTFSPAIPLFPTITQGTSSAAQTLTVISSGTAPLHVASVSLAGPNPLDFSLTNNCTAPVSPAANCTILLGFNPIGPGQRTANLMIADDVAGSPQTVSLSATANPAFTPGPAPNGSTAASVPAGQTAQFLLQLTPGTGYSGTVSLACSGAPLNATCQVPESVAIANGVPAPFTVTVSTRGGAMLPPPIPRRFAPPTQIRVLVLLAFALLLLIKTKNRWMFDGCSQREALGVERCSHRHFALFRDLCGGLRQQQRHHNAAAHRHATGKLDDCRHPDGDVFLGAAASVAAHSTHANRKVVSGEQALACASVYFICE